MTKNVALVDNELQGKKYTSNKGGSGFGKFKQLPNPKVIGFQKNEELEVFIGSHDGFKNVGVEYSRQVINIENDFWIVKDNFSSDKKHTYKQVWQGHYSLENSPNLLRSSFSNGAGLDIYQLNKVDKIKTDGARGKQWSVTSKTDVKDFNFITILFPFAKYDNRINEEKENPNFNDWSQNSSIISDATQTLSKNNKHLFFGVKEITIQEKTIHFSEKVDVLIRVKENNFSVQSLYNKPFTFKKRENFKEKTIKPLEVFTNK
jgi:hypothetical protein